MYLDSAKCPLRGQNAASLISKQNQLRKNITQKIMNSAGEEVADKQVTDVECA